MSTKRTIFGAVVLAIALGILAALPLGRNRELSVEIWLTAAALWLAALLIRAIFRAAPVASGDLRGLWGRVTAPAEPPARLPRDLVALEGTVVGGRDGARAFTQRLRPRLIPIVRHGLETHHGVDMDRHPTQAAALLGDEAWMVDRNINDRAPSLEQVHRLLDRVLPEEHQ